VLPLIIKTMKYVSDYLGRMKEITYPDGEIVRYGYGYGGQIKSVKGERINTKFDYVTMIGYDEYGQRVYIKYGNGTETKYKYDQYRRWLSGLDTNNNAAGKVQDMKYTFDDVGNVLGYENNARGYTTGQSYSYDALYQLTGVQGTSKSHPGGIGGNEEYKTDYKQKYDFNRIGNMTSKVSEENVSNTNRIGAPLNYSLEYEYYKGTHKAERIGNRYYDYDLNGNISFERDGGHATTSEINRPYYQEGDKYWAEYGFGLVKPKPENPDDGIYQRNYKWNERNLLSETKDNTYTVQYRYGADGQRALKFNVTSGRSTVYFNKMWQASDSRADWLQSKHIYLNEDRIATKYNSEGNPNTEAEKTRVYFYHSDHLGSAQVVTNYEGKIHERLEYTPYGELWIDWKSETALEDKTPFRFTGKEMDAETGLYYYGARYLDPKTSRWLSGDPAMGEYFPSAPVNDETRKRNQNLPGQGGVFNHVNLHAYHYAGNNPVKYVDPDGEVVIPIQGQYLMQPGGYDCAVVLAANFAYTAGSVDTTPDTITNNRNNFPNGLGWAVVNLGRNVVLSERTDGSLSIDRYNQLNAETTEYMIGIRVNYSGNANDHHWVGVAGTYIDTNGRAYFRITPSSTNDSNMAATPNSNRGGQEWFTENGNIFVPVDMVTAYVIYTVTPLLGE